MPADGDRDAQINVRNARHVNMHIRNGQNAHAKIVVKIPKVARLWRLVVWMRAHVAFGAHEIRLQSKATRVSTRRCACLQERGAAAADNRRKLHVCGAAVNSAVYSFRNTIEYTENTLASLRKFRDRRRIASKRTISRFRVMNVRRPAICNIKSAGFSSN